MGSGNKKWTHKLKNMNITLIDSKKIKTKSIKEAIANLECKLIDERNYGDHTFFIGKVLYYTYKKEAFKEEKPNLEFKFLAHIAMDEFVTFLDEIYKVNE